MSPLAFLAIPLVVFVVGSSLLWLKHRIISPDFRLRRAPDNLQAIAPTLQQQRENGWKVDAATRNYRN